jgi:starvation-inducible DNA-binding protein
MKPNIEISDNNLKEVATLLNTLLADEFVLYTKTRNAHWNIQSKSFLEMHKLFEEQYHTLEDIIDEVAERVRTLGHFAVASLKDYIKLTHLTEDDDDYSTQDAAIKTLLLGNEVIIRIIRNDIAPIADKYKDLGTADFVTGIIKQHEKMAWMLRAYLA